jgi:hypothetical protein
MTKNSSRTTTMAGSFSRHLRVEAPRIRPWYEHMDQEGKAPMHHGRGFLAHIRAVLEARGEIHKVIFERKPYPENRKKRKVAEPKPKKVKFTRVRTYGPRGPYAPRVYTKACPLVKKVQKSKAYNPGGRRGPDAKPRKKPKEYARPRKHLEHKPMDSAPKGVCLGDGRAKLTIERVRELRADWTSGVMAKDLAIKYGVSYPTVRKIVEGKVWIDWPGRTGSQIKRKADVVEISEETIGAVCRALEEGGTLAGEARKYGITRNTLRKRLADRGLIGL